MRVQMRRPEVLLGLGALGLLVLLSGGPAYSHPQSDTLFVTWNTVDITASVEAPTDFYVTAPFVLYGKVAVLVSAPGPDPFSASGRSGNDWNMTEAHASPWSYRAEPYTGVGETHHWYSEILGPTGYRIGASWGSTSTGDGMTVVDTHQFQVS